MTCTMLLVMHLFVLLALCLFPPVSSSNVVFKNNGYENVVIAIHPEIPENDDIIRKIQTMITDSSSFLFNATKQRAYFRTVKILIPSSWTNKTFYQTPKTETFDNADVIVAEANRKYGDEPYTLQYGRCGERGRYIHLTPTFLLSDTLIDVYGPRGDSLFGTSTLELPPSDVEGFVASDNYNRNELAQSRQSVCSTDIKGVQVSKGTSSPCKFNETTGLPDEQCVFIPNKTQSTTSSVMYLQGLPSAVGFEATNSPTEYKALMVMGNRKTKVVVEVCSVLEMEKKDKKEIGGPGYIVEIDKTLFTRRKSNAGRILPQQWIFGGYNRKERLKQAGEVFLLQIIEAGSYAGIVTFNSNATITKNLVHLDNYAKREELANSLPTSANSGTNICRGVLKGFEVLEQVNGGTSGKEIVLLTDGEDSGINNCFTEVKDSGSIIHTISLGPQAAKELEQLADMTGGLKFYATDSLDSNGLVDAFTRISCSNGNHSQKSIQLESNGLTVKTKEWFNSTVSIDKSVGKDTFFVITWQTSEPDIYVQTSSRRIYMTADFKKDTTLKAARLQILGTAETGDWSYSLYNTDSSSQTLGITVTTRAADQSIPPVIVNVHMNTDKSFYPAPMVVYAEVSQGFLPVVKATVIATIESENGKSVTLELFDNGADPDVARCDGIYSRYFTSFTGSGRYSLKVRVQGKETTSLASRRQNRAAYIPGFVDNGQVQFNPSKPSVKDDGFNVVVGRFSRTSSGGSFSVAGVPSGPLPDKFPPNRISDLEAEMKEDTFILTWTAPGNDYDLGNASDYEIRMSKNLLTLRNDFSSAEQINTSHIIPLPAGSQESFSFKLEDVVIENRTILYFAARASDEAANLADVSNIAQAAMIIPSDPISEASNGISITVLVLIVAVSLIVVLIIVSAVVRGVNNRKRRDYRFRLSA
ncbi:calcium-activated chloride channel regulator 1-like [Protopterus annectens]|uniref:calcium-activated chloride channel regulator 1-like n=1 Tax=Protopterus annectens TaxID=7888 RepID=UPI001CF9AD44|nr:calcium-activated chloride channel regulator 1-like [Protopterus annectens]